MRKISICFFFIIFLLTKGYGQNIINHQRTTSISASLLKTIDSAFNYRKYTKENNRKYGGVRIIDKTGTFTQSQSWEYFKNINNTPYVVLTKFPYNFNSHRYCDIVILNANINGDSIKVKAFSLVYKSCDQLPIFISKIYVLKDGKIQFDKTRKIMHLDNWKPYQNTPLIINDENK